MIYSSDWSCLVSDLGHRVRPLSQFLDMLLSIIPYLGILSTLLIFQKSSTAMSTTRDVRMAFCFFIPSLEVPSRSLRIGTNEGLELLVSDY